MYKVVEIAGKEFAVPTQEAYEANLEMTKEFKAYCAEKGFSEEESNALVTGVQTPEAVPVEGIALIAGKLEEIALGQLATRLEAAGLTDDFSARSATLTVEDHVNMLNASDDDQLLTVLSAIPVPTSEDAATDAADEQAGDPVVFETTDTTEPEPEPAASNEIVAVNPNTGLEAAPAAKAIVEHAALNCDLDAQELELMAKRKRGQADLYRKLSGLPTSTPEEVVLETKTEVVADEAVVETV